MSRAGGARVHAALALALCAAAPTADAQMGLTAPPRAYFSVGAGGSSYSADCGGARECDRVGGAARGALGFFLNPDYGLELAAADFGKSRVGDRYGDAEFRVRMVGVGLVVPLDYGARFNGLLRFGVAGVRATLTPLASGSAPAASGTSVEGYYGLTLGYLLTPQLAAELSLDGTRGYAGFAGGRVDALTLGLSLRF